MAYIRAIPFRALLWLVPVFSMLHNLEEARFMESWSKRLPIKVHPTVSIHLAAALIWQEALTQPVTPATYDQELVEASKKSGLKVLPEHG